MNKRGLVVFVLLAVVLVGFASAATSVSMTTVSSTKKTVNIASAVNLYAYEVAFDYTSSISSVDDANFLGSDFASTTSSSNEKTNILYVYSSRLDSAQQGISGSGQLFDVTHDGTLSLRYAMFVTNDSTETLVLYNVSSVTCGDGTCEGTETCANCPSDCGQCASGGSTGGGGGGSAPPSLDTLTSSPSSFNLAGTFGLSAPGKISLTNTGDVALSVTPKLSGLLGIVNFKKSLVNIAPGATEILEFDIVSSSEPGIYTGKLIFSANNKNLEVPFALNVRSELSLFDVSVDLADEFKHVSSGDKITSQITLLQAGLQEKMDVTLNYVVKDFDGNVHLTESETVMVFQQKSFNKEIDTHLLAPGDYVLGAEVIYPGGIATASSQFSVVDNSLIGKSSLIYWILLASVLIVFVIIIIVLVKFRKLPRRAK